uniref:Uncharacterized protein n=1 Tax=Strongyloides stercoralis TaxID=6248 RepID=A0AAF5DDI5_STRER
RTDYNFVSLNEFKYVCESFLKKLRRKTRSCYVFININSMEFPKRIFPSLMEADFHNFHYYYYNERNESELVPYKLNGYIQNNLNQTNIARICSGLKIKYRFPTFLFVYQTHDRKTEKNLIKKYKIIVQRAFWCLNKYNSSKKNRKIIENYKLKIVKIYIRYYNIFIFLFIINILLLIDGYKYECKRFFRKRRKRPCLLYVNINLPEFKNKVMTRFNRYDYHNLQFLYQQRFRNPRNVVKMREYVENNLNQKDISRVCSGLKIKYRFPTKLILFQANGKKAERQFYKFYKKIIN